MAKATRLFGKRMAAGASPEDGDVLKFNSETDMWEAAPDEEGEPAEGGGDTVDDRSLTFSLGIGSVTVWFRVGTKRVTMEVPEQSATGDGETNLTFTIPADLKPRQNLNFTNFTMSDNDGFGSGIGAIIGDTGVCTLYNSTGNTPNGSLFLDGFCISWTRA